MTNEEMKAIATWIGERRNQIKTCPICGGNIADRHVTLYKGLIKTLHAIYMWCGQNKRHEFQTKEVKTLMGKNEYARFGDLIRFGGIVYKPTGRGKAWYGINMERASLFFHGQYKIPVQITLNQITGQIVDAHYVSITEFPELKEILNAEGGYDINKLF